MKEEVTKKYRHYSVKDASGAVTARGMVYEDEIQYLIKSYPEPEFTIILDQLLPFPEKPKTYADLRKQEYPSIGEFIDALYWEHQGNPEPLTQYFAKITAIKAKHPKQQKITK